MLFVFKCSYYEARPSSSIIKERFETAYVLKGNQIQRPAPERLASKRPFHMVWVPNSLIPKKYHNLIGLLPKSLQPKHPPLK